MKIRKAIYSKKEVDTLRRLEYKRGVDTDWFRARDRVTELNRIDNAKFDSDDGYHVFRIKELEIDKDMEYGVEV